MTDIPLDPPKTQPANPPLGGLSAAESEAMVDEKLLTAAGSIGITIDKLQADIAFLQQTNDTMINGLARLNEALRALPCPQDKPAMRTETAAPYASIGDCIACAECHCEIGYILTAATWMPTPPSGTAPD